MNLNNSSGMTVIELLTSVAIVLILSSIAVTSFTIYKEQASNTEQKQLFNAARTAIEGRDDNVDKISGYYRRIWQPYNSDIWSRYNVPVLTNFAPGIPKIVPNHIDMYLREYKCGPTSSGWCQTQFVESWNCQTGNWLYHVEYKNGQFYDYENYNSYIDSYC